MSPAAHTDLVGGLEMAGLRERYRAGSLTPVEVVDAVLARIAARGDDAVWISRVPDDEVRARAAALDPALVDDLPLFGIPFAVKDNIDVAGLVTTAACPDFGYRPETTAPAVARLLAAGALLVGKTNLDQFATGLSGARSPYGTPSSSGDPRLISGGSSSGSAVAVAAGLVSFTLGTDTAGSGRVPAALNGIVGLKPSIGLVSAAGVVPACRSLDCVSVFASSVAESAQVLHVAASFDRADAWSRPLPLPAAAPTVVGIVGLRVGVPDTIPRWGARGEQQAWEKQLDLLSGAGAELVPLDMTDFLEAGTQLYGGAWVAERLDGLEELMGTDSVLPVIRSVLERGAGVRGVDTFAALTRVQELRQATHAVLGSVDVLLTPTVTETFTIEEMLADPIALNSRLGTFTTFTNLLDLCAVAVPAGGPPEAPFGVTVQAVAGHDAFVLSVAEALERVRSGSPAPVPDPPADGLLIAVVGAHLRGMPLHPDLVSRGAQLVERTATAPTYRLFALAGATQPKPGLLRVTEGGAAIEVEVYRMPLTEVGGLLATVVAPLAIGQIRLADGREVHGFVCEPAGFDGAQDITEHGGWRMFRSRGTEGTRR